MPQGSNDSGKRNTEPAGQEKPVVFQKYFKSGARTYASQIKLASNGRKYLVLTEGVRDPQTDEVKKHYLRVFDQDLKEFFAMLQETVLYLRATKDEPNPISAVKAAKLTKGRALAAKPTPVRVSPNAPTLPQARAKAPASAAKVPAAKPVRRTASGSVTGR